MTWTCVTILQEKDCSKFGSKQLTAVRCYIGKIELFVWVTECCLDALFSRESLMLMESASWDVEIHRISCRCGRGIEGTVSPAQRHREQLVSTPHPIFPAHLLYLITLSLGCCNKYHKANGLINRHVLPMEAGNPRSRDRQIEFLVRALFPARTSLPY